jgi:hypothetical protein
MVLIRRDGKLVWACSRGRCKKVIVMDTHASLVMAIADHLATHAFPSGKKNKGNTKKDMPSPGYQCEFGSVECSKCGKIYCSGCSNVCPDCGHTRVFRKQPKFFSKTGWRTTMRRSQRPRPEGSPSARGMNAEERNHV